MALSELAKLGIILGTGILVLVLGIVVQKKIRAKKNSEALFGGYTTDTGSSSSQVQNSNAEDKAIVDYIQKYKSQFSKDAIKQALVGSGKDPAIVDSLLSKYF